MTYVVINELFVDADDVAVFETNFSASMQGTLNGVPGLEAARLLAPAGDDRGYLSVLEFVDRSAYEAYRASPAFEAAHRWPDHAPFKRNQLAEFTERLRLGSGQHP